MFRCGGSHLSNVSAEAVSAKVWIDVVPAKWLYAGRLDGREASAEIERSLKSFGQTDRLNFMKR